MILATGTPRISVVTPLFQKAPHVPDALGSAFRQTMEGFEAIVADDGSTDEGRGFLRRWRIGASFSTGRSVRA